MSYTDAKVRRNIIVNGVKSVKDLSKDEFKMVPSATLKLELTEKMDKALQDKVKNKMPRKGKSVQTRNEDQYPTGVKYHMFKEVMEDMEGARKNNWQSIFKLMGL